MKNIAHKSMKYLHAILLKNSSICYRSIRSQMRVADVTDVTMTSQ